MKKIIEFLKTNLTKKVTSSVGYRISEIIILICCLISIGKLFIVYGKLWFENEEIKEDKKTLQIENELLYEMFIQEKYGIVPVEQSVQGDISIVCE